MKNYVLVIVNGHNHVIGGKRYTQSEAIARQAEVAKVGLQMEVMTENEAFGIN